MVAVSFAPVQPSGWPSAMAPPLTLTIAGSSPAARITASACAAKASLSSITPMSSSFRPGEREGFGNRHHRTDAHDFRRHAGRGEADEAGLRLQAEFSRFGRGHHERRRGAIAGLRGIARRHRAVRMKDGLQFGQRFERGIGARAFVFIEDRFGVDRLRAVAVQDG